MCYAVLNYITLDKLKKLEKIDRKVFSFWNGWYKKITAPIHIEAVISPVASGLINQI